jgi:hypothetical protein
MAGHHSGFPKMLQYFGVHPLPSYRRVSQHSAKDLHRKLPARNLLGLFQAGRYGLAELHLQEKMFQCNVFGDPVQQKTTKQKGQGEEAYQKDHPSKAFEPARRAQCGAFCQCAHL